MLRVKNLLPLVAALFVGLSAAAAPAERSVKIIVTPDHYDWNYRCGEKPHFTVTVLKHNNPVENAEITYQLSEDMMKPHVDKSLTLKKGTGDIAAGTMRTPGFLRCRVFYKEDGFTYEGTATAAFDPEKLEPTVSNPADFDDFWEKALRDNERVPLEPVVTLLPDRCTGKVNVYKVSFQNYRRGLHIYGIMCVPVAEGKHPAMLIVPGAGVRGYKGYMATAEQGIVTLQIGINGIPLDLDPRVYEELASGALNNYYRYRIDDRDKYYYKRVYLGCARAVDFLAQSEFVDADRIAVCGGSQGGALTITTAVLNPKVKYAAAYYPALCDMTGYLHGRGGGWPHLFANADDEGLRTEATFKTIPYYDVVNFARRIKVPVFMSMGYNDMVCCPTSTMTAYNVITSPKELHLYLDTKHYTYSEQDDTRDAWLVRNLTK